MPRTLPTTNGFDGYVRETDAIPLGLGQPPVYGRSRLYLSG